MGRLLKYLIFIHKNFHLLKGYYNPLYRKKLGNPSKTELKKIGKLFPSNRKKKKHNTQQKIKKP
jgi:hypothetical protein